MRTTQREQDPAPQQLDNAAKAIFGSASAANIGHMGVDIPFAVYACHGIRAG